LEPGRDAGVIFEEAPELIIIKRGVTRHRAQALP
jgi:hypothetical protein